MSEPIKSFMDNYRFLSNFWPAPIVIDGIQYPTTEHAYQALKSILEDERRMIAGLQSPGMAKRAGRKVTMRPDWEDVKVEVMRLVLKRKFTAENQLGLALMLTWNSKLIEGNNWHDNFWGECQCARCAGGRKLNILGELLMEIRRELIQEFRAIHGRGPN